VHFEDDRIANDACNRRDVADEIEVELIVKRRIDCVRRINQEQRVAGIAPRSVELCEASAAVNDVKRPSRFVQQRGCLFPFRSEQQARLVRPEVA
jgi:hypothetical protein